MSIVSYKKLKTDQGKAATQDESNSEWTEGTTKRKKHMNTSTVLHKTNLLDLNVDCLYEIFKHVSVMDLALIARTCKKLKEIATDIFVRSHKICDFESMAMDAATVARLLNTFGSSILDLRIDFTPYESVAVKIVDSILRNCTELKSLTMMSYDIPDCQDEFKKIRQLFGKLHSLHIVEIRIKDWESWMELDDRSYMTPNGNVMNLFGDCHSLVDFKIADCFLLERPIFDQNFPKLEHFHYEDRDQHLVKGVRAFVFRHSDLKTLSLGYNININGAIEVIAANCTKLEELQLHNEGEDPQPGKLYEENYGISLRQLSKLQYLTILNIRWYIKNLNVREFDFALVDIIQRLADLKKFNIDVDGQQGSYHISKNVYVQIVKIVENRPVVKNCYLELDCPTTQDFEEFLRPSVEFKPVPVNDSFPF